MSTINRGFTMRTFIRLLAALALVAGLPFTVQAQTTVTQTTLSAALSAPAQGAPNNLVSLASATGVVAPTATSVGTELFVDQEAMLVLSISGTLATVQRGYDNTIAVAHPNSQIVYVGPTSGAFATPFVFTDPPIGSCTLGNESYSLRINVRTGKIFQCTNSVWMNVIDSFQFIGPSNCWYSTSGGTFTTPAAVTNIGLYAAAYTGLVASATAPGTPMLQVATTNGGQATNTVSCQVPVPSRTNVTKGVYVIDATWLYGVQQNALAASTSQAVVAASGTMNGVVAFGQIALPTPGASETASTVAQARWDTGSINIVPCTISSNACSANQFNVATNTVGQFYTSKITPGNPAPMTSDLTAYYVNFTWLCQNATATTVNIAGVLIHYRTLTSL